MVDMSLLGNELELFLMVETAIGYRAWYGFSTGAGADGRVTFIISFNLIDFFSTVFAFLFLKYLINLRVM